MIIVKILTLLRFKDVSRVARTCRKFGDLVYLFKDQMMPYLFGELLLIDNFLDSSIDNNPEVDFQGCTSKRAFNPLYTSGLIKTKHREPHYALHNIDANCDENTPICLLTNPVRRIVPIKKYFNHMIARRLEITGSLHPHSLLKLTTALGPRTSIFNLNIHSLFLANINFKNFSKEPLINFFSSFPNLKEIRLKLVRNLPLSPLEFVR